MQKDINLEIIRISVCQHRADGIDHPLYAGKRARSRLDIKDLKAALRFIAHA